LWCSAANLQLLSYTWWFAAVAHSCGAQLLSGCLAGYVPSDRQLQAVLSPCFAACVQLLLRYLRAEKLDPQKASDRLERQAAWRHGFGQVTEVG